MRRMEHLTSRKIGSFTRTKHVLLTLCLSFLAICALGQNTIQNKQGLYFELAGSGGLGSVNYERFFLYASPWTLSWSAGLSFAPIDKNNGTGIVFPVMLHSTLGKKALKLELGIGQGITLTTKGSLFALTTLAVGTRIQASGSRWYYRVTFTPLISYLVDFQVQPWCGISIGYAFKNKAI